MTRKYFLFTLIFNTLLSGFIFAEDNAHKTTIKEPSYILANRKQTIKIARQINRKQYPNADDVMVEDYIRVKYNADGTSERINDCYFKILTERGRRDASTISFHFTIPYSTPADIGLKMLEIINDQGDIKSFSQKEIKKLSKVMISPSSMRSNIYNPNRKILRVRIPGLRIGDTVHYISFRRVVHPRVKNSFSDIEVFEYTSPIKHATYEVLGPKELPLKNIVLKDEIKGTVICTTGEKDGLMHYRWEIRDVKRMFKEPDMPNLLNVVQRLLVSTNREWKEVSRWYWNLSEPHLKTSPEIEAKVNELVKGIKNDEKKISAIFHWVSQNIRYAGITLEKVSPGYEPRDVAMTFSKRHGVCRDKAALLCAMLRSAGFKAFPVLIHNGPKKDIEVPQAYFNHAISAVEIKLGEYLLMDSTDENTRSMLPEYLNDQSYLVARPEGETLRTTPVVAAEKNLVRIKTAAKVDADGRLQGNSILTFDGHNDNSYRTFFARSRPEKRRRYFEGIVKFSLPGATLKNILIKPEKIMDVSQPLQVILEYEAENILVGTGDTKIISLPQFGTRIGAVNRVLGKIGLKQRQYPLKTGIACGVKEKISLTIDPLLGSLATLPSCPEINNNFLLWKKVFSQKDSTLAVNSEFLVKVVEFSAEEYGALKNAVREMEYQTRRCALIKKNNASAVTPVGDVIIIHDRMRYDLDDINNWNETHCVKKKILTYKGKKEHGRIKINYNSAWEKIFIEQATVIDPRGKIRHVSKEDINIMDAPWVGGAPRYPPSRTFVMILPGVEVGSVIEYRIRRECRNRPFFATNYSFRQRSSCQLAELTISAPTRMEWVEYSQDPKKNIITKTHIEKSRRVKTWKAINQPSVKDEGVAPPWWSYNPSVFVSCGSWKNYARKINPILAKAAYRQKNTITKARQLVAGKRDYETRIRAIRDYVAKNIRLAGPQLNRIPLKYLTPADVTLYEGYGNSTDRAIVLYAMLRAIGFRAEFVASGTWAIAPELRTPFIASPDSLWLDKILVKIALPKIGDIYLNDTGQYAALGSVRAEGRLAVSLTNGKIRKIAPRSGMNDLKFRFYNLTVNPDGSAMIETTRKFFGNGFEFFNKKFSEMTPEQRKRYHEKEVAKISQSATPDGQLAVDFSSYPGSIKFKVKLSRFAVREGSYMFFEFPASLKNLFRFWADTRDAPYHLSKPKNHQINIALKLPDGFRLVSAPQNFMRKMPGGKGGVSIKEIAVTAISGGILPSFDKLWQYQAQIPAQVVSPEGYAKMLDLYRALSHPDARTILLEKVEK